MCVFMLPGSLFISVTMMNKWYYYEYPKRAAAVFTWYMVEALIKVCVALLCLHAHSSLMNFVASSACVGFQSSHDSNYYDNVVMDERAKTIHQFFCTSPLTMWQPK